MKLRLILSAASVLALASSCSRKEDSAGTSTALASVQVRVVTARIASMPSAIEVSGVVRPVRRATLAAKLMGNILEMPVALGQDVRAGDLLVRISAGEIAARLAQAQAQLDQADFDLARERDLLSKNASTADLVHNLETRASVARAMVHEAETFLGYAEIRAPFDGVVSRKSADVGDLASPGTLLLEIDGTDAYEIESELPDSVAGLLKVGVAVDVALPTSGTTFAAKLTELSSAADSDAHTVPAKFSVPSGVAMRVGQFARLRVPGKPTEMLLVPASAISRQGQMERVFVVGEGHRAVLRLVKTGAATGDRIEVLSGVDDGEVVVLSPPVGLREGQPLEVQP